MGSVGIVFCFVNHFAMSGYGFQENKTFGSLVVFFSKSGAHLGLRKQTLKGIASQGHLPTTTRLQIPEELRSEQREQLQ